jgi:hypothetical protein
MNELQKKVLLFLLKELDEQVKEWSCDAAEIPALTEEERRLLTQMMWGHWGLEEEWDGSGQKVLQVNKNTWRTFCPLPYSAMVE